MDNSGKNVWDRIAVSWSQRRYEMPSEVEAFWTGVDSGRVLDVGCGSGRNFMNKENVVLYGVDVSSEMIRLARESASEREINVVCSEIVESDLVFDSDYFDYILCWAVLHCVDGREGRMKLLHEMYRVLKPSGTLFISVWSGSSTVLRAKDKECIVDWKISDDLSVGRYTYVYDKDEFENELRSVGFEIVESVENNNIVCRCVK